MNRNKNFLKNLTYRLVKGHIPWNKGIPRTKEEKEKISKTQKRLYQEGKIIPWNKGTKGLQVSGMKGKHQTEEAKQKMSIWKTNRKMLKTRSKNHWNWKGGKTSLNKQLRNTISWKVWRIKIFERDNWTCLSCNKKGKRLHPHHTPKSFKQLIKENNIKTPQQGEKCKELWDVNNGITLCEECHKLTNNYLKR